MGPIGRRQFVAGAGGVLLTTLAGHSIAADAKADTMTMTRQTPVPPAVAAHPEDPWTEARAAQVRARVAAAGGSVREHWIKAVKTPWNIVPTHRDAMMDMPVTGPTRFTAMAYRPFSRGFTTALGPPSIPGPRLEAEVGDTIVVHFRNETGMPVTMHPHGIFYSEDMDGAYKGHYTTLGGFVQNGRTFTYIWEAREGTQGAWFYHDHGPMDPLGVYSGLFGSLIIREPTAAVPDHDFFVCFHSFTPVATGLDTSYMCINGRAYAGNTPTFKVKVGETVAWHVFGMDDNFHVFHVHGHRWTDPDGGQIIDSQVLGPGDIVDAQYVEDNPGRWFYHCHVFSHLHMGMNGWYLVDD